MKYTGSCHCGDINYEVEGEIDTLLECNCSICSRRGYLLWFTSASQVDLKTPEDNMSTYTFNKHHIRHTFCKSCGCAPISFGADAEGNEMAAINARCLEDFDISSLPVNQYDGRSV